MDTHALVNRYMKELSVKAVFTRVDIWTEKNLMNTSLTVQGVLQIFHFWRDYHILKRLKHDDDYWPKSSEVPRPFISQRYLHYLECNKF